MFLAPHRPHQFGLRIRGRLVGARGAVGELWRAPPRFQRLGSEAPHAGATEPRLHCYARALEARLWSVPERHLGQIRTNSANSHCGDAVRWPHTAGSIRRSSQRLALVSPAWDGNVATPTLPQRATGEARGVAQLQCTYGGVYGLSERHAERVRKVIENTEGR